MTRSEYLENINKVIKGIDVSADFPVMAPVVAMFLEQFSPEEQATPSGDNMTSFEIAQALEDTCQVSTTDIARVMVYLGYRLTVNSLRGHEWQMTAVTTSGLAR